MFKVVKLDEIEMAGRVILVGKISRAVIRWSSTDVTGDTILLTQKFGQKPSINCPISDVSHAPYSLLYSFTASVTAVPHPVYIPIYSASISVTRNTSSVHNVNQPRYNRS